MDESTAASGAAAASAPPTPGAVHVIECCGGYCRRGIRGCSRRVASSGGRTYTTCFCVVLPVSVPTEFNRSDGTRFTITDVFFHTRTASSA
jgi:hypothetical protein